MTGVAAHIPGLIRQFEPPRPQIPPALLAGFPGLLEPDIPAGSSESDAAARAFGADGLIGGEAVGFPDEGRSLNAAATPVIASVAEPPPAQVISEASPLPVPATSGNEAEGAGSRASSADVTARGARFNGGRQSAEPRHFYAPAPASIVPAQTDERLSDPGMQGRAASARSPAPQRRQPAVAPVQVSINVQGALAAVSIRGEIPIGALEARLKQTLAEFDLALATLHLNGIDQGATPYQIEGGSNGHR